MELSEDNILTVDEAENLFTSEESDTTKPEELPQEVIENKEAAEGDIDPENLFNLEGVGGEENQEGEILESKTDADTSPNNFYSSIATACKEEGIFPDLDDESLNAIKDADGFKEAMTKQIQALLDEKQKRINEALDYGVEPAEIQKYQKAIDWLDSIEENSIRDEGEDGEKLRRSLIFNDFINRGISKDRAQKLTQRAFDAGTDIEDAIDALNSNKEFIKTEYDRIIEESKEQTEAEREKEKKQMEDLKKSILETDEPFKGIKLDKGTRQKVFEAITKPVFKDSEGNMYTAVQKAQLDDNIGFIKKLGYLYTLTNGFKDLESIVKDRVNKETKKGFRAIENALRNQAVTGGEPRFATGVSGDEREETMSGGLLIDLQH